MSKDTSKNINKKGEKEGTERNERDVFYLVPPNIDKLNKELEELKELNEMLIKINEKFRKENDRLYERIDFYKNLRMPRSMKKNSKPKRKHQRNNDSEDLDDKIIDMDAEMDEKDKKDDKDEKDDKDARITAKALYNKDDMRITYYEKQEMINIIQDIRYHSPELSETNEENASKKCQIVVRRNYDDTLQNFDVQPLNDVPQWTCVEPGNGNVVYDSNIGYESIYDDYMYDDADTF
ncbi:hypothetical protein RhiirA1_476030 [Rhizophagus irregularis]|uniref:Uncharacterized protein n=1 Tax=Rhizophagus irregularis TaxID=588596 RepID=A0A2N0QVX2_9GLOM|nr:hypothetical protein RhiirA1_476030 [Rhizophagus irregularis]